MTPLLVAPLAFSVAPAAAASDDGRLDEIVVRSAHRARGHDPQHRQPAQAMPSTVDLAL